MNQLSFFSEKQSHFKVSEVNNYIRELMEGDITLQDLWVRGEVSNMSRPKSGHLYFTIKDEKASLRCVMWKNQAARLVYLPQDGDEIEVHGSISVYEASGQYQLYADQIRPVGEGLLYQEFQRLKDKLNKEGLFDGERKRPIPSRPKTIGIVTSPTGAALRDILNTIRRRYPIVEIYLAGAAVQGKSSSGEIAKSLHLLNDVVKPDVIILARGGGSIEDLWSFNEEEVAWAIFNSGVPVISGVGHETDFTIADFTADLRAPTPTAAAELAVPERSELLNELFVLLGEMEGILTENIDDNKWALREIGVRLDRKSPESRLQSDRQRLDEYFNRLNSSLMHELSIKSEQVKGMEQKLAALNPIGILERGYSVLTDMDGNVISKMEEIDVGEHLKVHVSDGGFRAEVKDKKE